MLALMLITFYALVAINALYVCFRFVYYFFFQKADFRDYVSVRYSEIWTVLVLPIFYLTTFDVGETNDCCGVTAVFSPAHSVGIYLLIFAFQAAYLISIQRKTIFPPLLEVLLNLLLLLGLTINAVLYLHLRNGPEISSFLGLFGNVPIIMLLLIQLSKHEIMLRAYLAEQDIEAHGLVGRLSASLLALSPGIKYPILALLLVPFSVLFSLILALFGQKPDTLIRAFTETYKHGFSELDHLCNNVTCGGHFLCSVGANGHRAIVRPVRYGVRKDKKIICTRQLLIANAFEEVIQERMPALHRVVRSGYNQVGRVVHRYYGIFKIKIVSDVVYFLMKPLEWVFLLVLYSCDLKPENRIARQYTKGAFSDGPP